MRRWYIIFDGKEHECDFISVNTLKNWVWLKLDGITFKVEFLSLRDYQDAKRGVEIGANAKKNNTIKLIKTIFK